MQLSTEALFAELRHLLTELDSDGGQISPSVYETAQVLRFCPEAGVAQETIQWLLQQQRPDGGWGDPSAPLYRTVPTMAALLALHERAPRTPRVNAAIHAGLAALRVQADAWRAPLPEDIPVAAELILPNLLAAAYKNRLRLPTAVFAELRALGERRRRLIAHLRPTAGTPPLHAWEAWGHQPKRGVIDGSGGVGHSPAATAWWLYKARARRHLKLQRRRARAYLTAAAYATGAMQPGVVPSPWPLHRFEMVFVLHSLLMADLLLDPHLVDVVIPFTQLLAELMARGGIGFSQFFAPDGDDTAAAVAILATLGDRSHAHALAPFQAADHFRAFPFELQHAPTVTARGAHALALCGQPSTPWLRALAAAQQPDGRWVGDKWNRSWLYTTAVVLHAFADVEESAPVDNALRALQAYQHQDGGWGSGRESSIQETAYAVLGLYTQRRSRAWNPALETVWRRASDYLLRHYQRPDQAPAPLWIDKELYTPRRVDRAFLLSALIVSCQSIAEPETRVAPGRVRV